MKQEIAQKILSDTKANYEQLSVAWDRTRQHADDLEEFRHYVAHGDRVLDVGCGNARLLKMLETVNVKYVGIDNSEAMLETAKKNFPQATFSVADILSLPFADNSFDVVFCLSTLHHVPSTLLRRLAMRELARMLKPGGTLIIDNWHYRSPHFMKKMALAAFEKITGRSALDFGDIMIPWGTSGIMRYVHLFSPTGMRRLAQKFGVNTVSCGISKQSPRGYYNLVFIGKKR